MSIESFLVRKELRQEVQRLESRVRLLEEQIGKLVQPARDHDLGVFSLPARSGKPAGCSLAS